jgi:hypothetical protein
MPTRVIATIERAAGSIVQLVSPKKGRGKRSGSNRNISKKPSPVNSPRVTRSRSRRQQQPPAPRPPSSPEPAASPNANAHLASPPFNLTNFNASGKGSPFPRTPTVLDDKAPVIEIEETFAPPPVRSHVVEELFDDPPARIKQEDDEDLPVEVANSDDGSRSLAVLVVPSFEAEAKEPSEHALMADAAARYEGFSAKPAPRSSAPQDDNAERAVKSRCITWFEREVSNHTVGDPRARGQVGWCLAEHWIDLRADRGHQEWVAIKKDEEIVLCYRPMPFDCLHLSYSGNAGEQLIVKADVYDESGYAEEGMVVWGVRGKRCYFHFESKSQYDCFIVAHTVGDGPKFAEEWYDKDGRFYQPPHANPFPVFNPNGMEVDKLNGYFIQERAPPLNERELDEEFDDFQPMSQAY